MFENQEATISPAFVYVTSMWYTRDEIPARTGVWFAGNSCGGFIASLLAYGIGQIDHPLHPWQWMFIVNYNSCYVAISAYSSLDIRSDHESLECCDLLWPARYDQWCKLSY
jgi:MFS family permease